MNTTKLKSPILVLIMLVGIVAAPSQHPQESVLDIKVGPVTTITKAQFDSAVAKMKYPPLEWVGKGVRIVFRYKDDDQRRTGVVQAFDNKEVYEYDAAGSTREYWELGAWARPAKGEKVFIGEEVYVRSEGGSWARASGRIAKKNIYRMFFAENEKDVTSLIGVPADAKITYDVSSGTYKGKPCSIFSRTLRENNTNRATGEVISSVKTFRYWLSDSFRLVKTEQLYSHKTNAGVIRQNFVTELEFDPSISISRPDIP